MNKSELLKKVPIFAELSDELLEELTARCQVMQFSKNATLMQEGDPGDHLYILESGSAKVSVGETSDEELVLFIMEPGNYVGDIALLDDSSRCASVHALEPCTALSIARDDFNWLFNSNPDLPRAIILSLTKRLREDNKRVRSLALDPVYRRLREKLYELADKNDKGLCQLPRKFSHRELGSMIGASRKMVSNILSDLYVGQYIELQKNIIVLQKTLPKDW